MNVPPLAAAASDECIGRAVMLKLGFVNAFQFRGRALRQHFAQLGTPLIK
jgi:hypothetical protein